MGFSVEHSHHATDGRLKPIKYETEYLWVFIKLSHSPKMMLIWPANWKGGVCVRACAPFSSTFKLHWHTFDASTLNHRRRHLDLFFRSTQQYAIVFHQHNFAESISNLKMNPLFWASLLMKSMHVTFCNKKMRTHTHILMNPSKRLAQKTMPN